MIFLQMWVQVGPPARHFCQTHLRRCLNAGCRIFSQELKIQFRCNDGIYWSLLPNLAMVSPSLTCCWRQDCIWLLPPHFAFPWLIRRPRSPAIPPLSGPSGCVLFILLIVCLGSPWIRCFTDVWMGWLAHPSLVQSFLAASKSSLAAQKTGSQLLYLQ